MSRNRDVFQVLVPSGNQNIAAEGTALSALLPGQLGIFSYNDNLAVDGTNLPDANNVYLALGQGTGGVLSDVLKSSGEFMSRQNIVGYSARCYTPERPKIIELTDLKVKCDTEYGIKFEFRNQQTYRTNAYNAVTKSYIVKSDCCDDCAEGCETGNQVTLAQRLADEVNNDFEQLIIAELIASQGSITITAEPTADGNVTVTLPGMTALPVAILNADTAAGVATKIATALNAVVGTTFKAAAVGAKVNIYGTAGTIVVAPAATGVTSTVVNISRTVVTDSAAFALENPNGKVDLRFTAIASTIYNYSDINLNYFDPRGTDIIASLIEGFGCSGILTVTQELIYEEGAGYDIRQLEYEAGGWNGKPGIYRTSTVNGVAREGFFYQASATGKYVTIYINANAQSIGGWQHYTNHISTILAIPTTDANTIDTFTTAMDLMVAGNLKPINDYATGCPAVTVANASTLGGDNFQDATPGRY